MDEPKEAAMAEPDTTLEEALEAVLVRYGIPAYGLRKGVMEADRGDMASDLADAARRALATPPAVRGVALAVKERLAAITQGNWVASVNIKPDDGGYWSATEVIVVDEIPVPDFSRALPEPDGEEAAQRVSDWSDAHYRGTVAETHNYYPIPDEQHDANQRLIAHAPSDLATLVAFVDRLTGG